MKKRIISMILVAVMALLALTGCAYNYAKSDLTDYATFDEDAFIKALGTLVVEDGEFGTDEAKRQEKVLDSIFQSLSEKADTEDKIKTGKPAKYNIYYYCYFCTATIKGKDVVLFASNMKESGATKLQLGLSSLKDLNKSVADAVADKDIKDYIYATNTDKKTAAGNTVYVSYVKEYESKVLDKDGNPEKDKNGNDIIENVKETVSYEKLVLKDGKGTTFLDKLVGQAVDASDVKFDIKENIGGKEQTVKYSSVKVNWIVDSMKEIAAVKDKTYTSDKTVKDIYNKEYNLKDVELTYHIFPVYFLNVISELTSDVVLKDLLADKITAESLDCFTDEKYKNGDTTLKSVIEKLAEKATDWAEAKEKVKEAKDALEKAKDAVEKAGGADKASTVQKENLTKAEADLKEAQKKSTEAETAVDDQVKEVYKCGKDLKDVIVKEYKEKRYKSLEDAYKTTLKQNLAKEIYKNAEKYVTYKYEDKVPVLPKKAVRDAYNRLVNNYKFDFYEGKYNSQSQTPSDKVSNYKYYNGDFNAYLKIATGLKSTSSMQEVYDVIGAKAENSVRELILLYTLADIYGDDVVVTKDDISEFKKSYQYIILSYQVGEDNVHEEDFIHAIQLDNIMNYLLEEKDIKEEDKKDNVVVYERVKYTVKTKSEEKADK